VEASTRLLRVLDHLGQNGTKQRNVVLADLASANTADGDQIARYLHQAIDAVEADWYRVGFDRIRKAGSALGDSQHGAALDERLNGLAVGRAALPDS
jgi:hypothetical protein